MCNLKLASLRERLKPSAVLKVVIRTAVLAAVLSAAAPATAELRVIARTGDLWPEESPTAVFSSPYFINMNNQGDLAVYVEFQPPSGGPSGYHHSLWNISKRGDRRLLLAVGMTTVEGHTISFNPHDTEAIIGEGGHLYAGLVPLQTAAGELLDNELVRPGPAGGLITFPSPITLPYFPPINVQGQMLVGSTQPISLWEADGSSRAVLSDPGPHLADGRYITDPDAVALSNAGIAYFLGTSEDVFRTPGTGLWSIDTTSDSYATAIIEPHAAVPDIGPNVRLDYCCSSRSISENGHVFVHGRLARGGTINLSNDTVLLLRRPNGELETIAQTGQRGPELSDNSRFAHLNGGKVNDAGDLIFSAAVRTSVVAPFYDVLYVQPHGSAEPQLIAKEGDPIFDDSTWELAGGLGPSKLNARGQVAFQSVPEGVDREHGSLWVWNPDGTYHSILNPGDTIEVAPGDIRRAAGVMLWTFNDRGELAFGVRFEDGSTALIVSDQVAIPEPTGAALLIVALGLCGLAGRHVFRNGRSTIREI